MPKPVPPLPPETSTRVEWVADFGIEALEIRPEAGIDDAREAALLRYGDWQALDPREALDRWRALASAKGASKG